MKYFFECVPHSLCEHFSNIEDLCILVREDQKFIVRVIAGELNSGFADTHYITIYFKK